MESLYQLDAASLEAVRSLSHACQEADGHTIPFYPHLLVNHRPRTACFLQFENNSLVGFGTLFHFYHDAVEICLMVHPKHRQKGIANQLWANLKSSISTSAFVKRAIVTSPHGGFAHFLQEKGFILQHTEYDMACAPKPKLTNHASIRKACPDDISALCRIDAACFDPDRPNPIYRLEKLMTTPNIHIFVLEEDHQIKGQVHLIFEEKHMRLTDLSVLPECQGQGLGKILLDFGLLFAKTHQQNKISLSVAALNKQALNLYQNMGFNTYNAVDYFEKSF